MQEHGSKIFGPQTPLPSPPWWWGQNSTFSEHIHIAYQIKLNSERSNMVANILPADPPPTPLPHLPTTNQHFSEHGHVTYQIKCNR